MPLPLPSYCRRHLDKAQYFLEVHANFFFSSDADDAAQCMHRHLGERLRGQRN
jgi:hypothetical protein